MTLSPFFVSSRDTLSCGVCVLQVEFTDDGSFLEIVIVAGELFEQVVVVKVDSFEMVVVAASGKQEELFVGFRGSGALAVDDT